MTLTLYWLNTPHHLFYRKSTFIQKAFIWTWSWLLVPGQGLLETVIIPTFSSLCLCTRSDGFQLSASLRLLPLGCITLLPRTEGIHGHGFPTLHSHIPTYMTLNSLSAIQVVTFFFSAHRNCFYIFKLSGVLITWVFSQLMCVCFLLWNFTADLFNPQFRYRSLCGIPAPFHPMD